MGGGGGWGYTCRLLARLPTSVLECIGQEGKWEAFFTLHAYERLCFVCFLAVPSFMDFRWNCLLYKSLTLKPQASSLSPHAWRLISSSPTSVRSILFFSNSYNPHSLFYQITLTHLQISPLNLLFFFQSTPRSCLSPHVPIMPQPL